MKVIVVMTLLIFRIGFGKEMPRQLTTGGAGDASGGGTTLPPPTCSYTGVPWNVDLGCTNCQHTVNVDDLKADTGSTSESFEVAVNDDLFTCDNDDGVSKKTTVVHAGNDCGLSLSGKRPLSVNYGGMTKTTCSNEATYTFTLTHAEIDPIEEEGTFTVNATYCWINA